MPADLQPPATQVEIPTAPVPQVTLEQWKQIVTVQMHFNDILMRTRTLAITVVLGAYGAAAVTLAQHPQRNVFFWNSYIHISSFVVGFALLLLLGVALLDFGYYYRLLLASVMKGEQLERENPTLTSITRQASADVPRWLAWLVITAFYVIPAVAGVLFLCHLLFEFPPQIGV